MYYVDDCETELCVELVFWLLYSPL